MVVAFLRVVEVKTMLPPLVLGVCDIIAEVISWSCDININNSANEAIFFILVVSICLSYYLRDIWKKWSKAK